MSRGGWRWRCGHGVVDGVDEVAFEGADGFASCFAFQQPWLLGADKSEQFSFERCSFAYELAEAADLAAHDAHVGVRAWKPPGSPSRHVPTCRRPRSERVTSIWRAIPEDEPHPPASARS